MSHATSLDRVLREQREAAATLPAAGGVLVSDWVAEEVLLLAADPASANAQASARDRADRAEAGSPMPR